MCLGFMPDAFYGANRVVRWVAGEPEPSWLGGIKERGKEQYVVVSFQCAKCGYLEMYAPS
jgi:hypothetical protein